MANRRLRHAISDAWNRGGDGLTRVIVPILRELIRLWNDGTLRVEVAGTEVGTRSTENFVAGAGVTITGSDDSTNERVDITIASSVTQYTDEMAQDAVGGMLVDGTTIDFTYTDATPALTAEVVAGSITATHIADGTVTPTELNNGTALSVLGRSANSAGVRADIAATAGTDAVLVEKSGAIGWFTVQTGGIADNAVTNAKAANMAEGTFKGRALGAGTGDPTDLSLAQDIAILTQVGTFSTADDVAGTITLAASTKRNWQMTDDHDGNVTIELDALVDGMDGYVSFAIDAGGPYTITFTSDSRTVKWCGGSAPTFSASYVFWIKYLAVSLNGTSYLLLDSCSVDLAA